MTRHRVGEAGAIAGACRRRGADAFAIGLRDPGPAVPAHQVDQAIRYVQRHHRDVMVSREAEDRQIERRIEAPDLLPVGLGQKFGLGQLATDPAVQHRLVRSRKHLEAEHECRIGRGEALDRRQLPAMVGRAVMLLAEQDDRLQRRAGGSDRQRRAGSAERSNAQAIRMPSAWRRTPRGAGSGSGTKASAWQTDGPDPPIFHPRTGSYPARTRVVAMTSFAPWACRVIPAPTHSWRVSPCITKSSPIRPTA